MSIRTIVLDGFDVCILKSKFELLSEKFTEKELKEEIQYLIDRALTDGVEMLLKKTIKREKND